MASTGHGKPARVRNRLSSQWMRDPAAMKPSHSPHQLLAIVREQRPEADRPGALPGEDSPAIEVSGLTKTYRHPWTLRETHGLRDASFEVRRGEVFGPR